MRYLSLAGFCLALAWAGVASAQLTGTVTCPSSLTVSAGSVTAGTSTTCTDIGTVLRLSPQGRLTLTTGKPVMSADVTAATTLYYDSYVGGLVWVWNGTTWVPLTITADEISMGLSATNHPANGFFDVFAVNNSGALALCTVAWTNGTTRASAVSLKNGIWTITAAPTHCYGGAAGATDLASAIGGANQAVLLGSMMTTATNGQTAMQFKPAGASGGNNTWRGIGNVYNMVVASSQSHDNGTTWTIAATTFAAVHASNSNRISWIDPLGQYPSQGSLSGFNQSGAGGFNNIALCQNAVTCAPAVSPGVGGASNTESLTVSGTEAFPPVLGANYLQGVEQYFSVAGTQSEFVAIVKAPY
jgi:hypothetical protein